MGPDVPVDDQVVDGQTEETEQPTAAAKREKTKKIHKQILVMVSIAGIMVGSCFVLIVYAIRLIGFNSLVMENKDKALLNYSKTIKNIGICNKPHGSDEIYTLDELKKCSPNSIVSDSLPGTLRFNIMSDMAANRDLESVARDLQSTCYKDGKVKDFKSLYEQEESEETKSYYLDMLKTCSALRAIPDALPAQENTEALLGSLNQLFNIAHWEPSSLAPDKNSAKSPYTGVAAIPASLSIDSNIKQAKMVLSTFEQSIRTFDISNLNIEWSSEDSLKFSATARAYYTTRKSIKEKEVTLSADPSKKNKTSAKGN